MKTTITAILLLLVTTAMAQQKTYTTTKDAEDRLVYNGTVTFSDLDHEQAFTWMKDSGKYKPSKKEINCLKEQLPAYTIIAFMGTWCPDSHDMMPKFEKVLQVAGYPQQQLKMYATDHDKKTKDGASEKYGIISVPTIILLKNGKEAGRITESVTTTVEGDLCRIINN